MSASPPVNAKAHEPARQPLLGLSVLWWFMLSGLGLFFPFYALYLSENVGLSGTQVGLVLASVPLVGLLAQPFWGGLADRSGARSAKGLQVGRRVTEAVSLITPPI